MAKKCYILFILVITRNYLQIILFLKTTIITFVHATMFYKHPRAFFQSQKMPFMYVRSVVVVRLLRFFRGKRMKL